jgi:hypothetical protein
MLSYQIEKISVGDENVISIEIRKGICLGKEGKLGEGLNGAVITTSQYVVDLNIKQTIDAYNDTQETVYATRECSIYCSIYIKSKFFTL